MKSTRVCWIGIAGKPVKAFGVCQTARTMMSGRGCERLFGTASDIHNDIPKLTAHLTSIARPITPKDQVHLTGASVNPDGLLARQRARQSIRRHTCNVRGGMQNEPAAAIGCRQNRLLLISDNVR